MSDVVLAALIGAVASIIVNVIAATQQSKKRAVEEAVKETRLESRLQSIEAKLDEHNGYGARFGQMSDTIRDIQMDVAVIKNDIKNLHQQA